MEAVWQAAYNWGCNDRSSQFDGSTLDPTPSDPEEEIGWKAAGKMNIPSPLMFLLTINIGPWYGSQCHAGR